VVSQTEMYFALLVHRQEYRNELVLTEMFISVLLTMH
jgi:hypothetical protein